MIKCKHCKKENKENVKFCVHCGKKIVKESHKEHKHTKDKNVLKFMKASGRILAYVFFGIIALTALFTFSIKSFIALLLAMLGIFIASPKFNSFTQKRFKKTLSTGVKIIILIVLFYTTPIFLDSSEDLNNNDFNLKGMSAEQVLNKYLDLLNYNGIDELLSNNLQRQRLSSGIVKEQLKLDYDYMKELKLISEELQKLCNEVKQIGYDVCGNYISLSLSTGLNNSVKILSKEIDEETESEAKITVKSKIISFSGNEKTEKVREITYILKKENEVWLVDDIIEDGELLSKSMDIEKRKQDNEKRISELKASLNKLKKQVEIIKSVHQLAANLKAKVQSNLPNNKIISFNIGSYKNQTDKFIIGVTYYFKDQWLVDDYLVFLGDATKIYEAIFTNSDKIMQVQITAKQKYKDDYGREQERVLGRSLMTKSTADKINWKSFESKNLDKITSVSFYGDSVYKDLKDLQKRLENWQSVSSYSLGLGAIPS